MRTGPTRPTRNSTRPALAGPAPARRSGPTRPTLRPTGPDEYRSVTADYQRIADLPASLTDLRTAERCAEVNNPLPHPPHLTADPASTPHLPPDERIQHLHWAYQVVSSERAHAKTRKGREAERDMPWGLFIWVMRVLTPQSWGARVEKYFIRFFGWQKVPPQANRGDAMLPDKRYVEIKTTMITSSNTDVNVVQIRPYQKLDGYRVFVIDPDDRVWRFDLTKKQMDTELATCGTNAHGTTATVVKNKNREYAIRFPWKPTDATCQRWVATYLVPDTQVPGPHQMPDGVYRTCAALQAAPSPAAGPAQP